MFPISQLYVALGVTPDGTKDILGLWIETSEGAKFCPHVDIAARQQITLLPPQIFVFPLAF
jgi:hypothetical protein